MEKKYVQKLYEKRQKPENYELLVKAISLVSQLTKKGKDEYYYCQCKQLTSAQVQNLNRLF